MQSQGWPPSMRKPRSFVPLICYAWPHVRRKSWHRVARHVSTMAVTIDMVTMVVTMAVTMAVAMVVTMVVTMSMDNRLICYASPHVRRKSWHRVARHVSTMAVAMVVTMVVTMTMDNRLSRRSSGTRQWPRNGGNDAALAMTQKCGQTRPRRLVKMVPVECPWVQSNARQRTTRGGTTVVPTRAPVSRRD